MRHLGILAVLCLCSQIASHLALYLLAEELSTHNPHHGLRLGLHAADVQFEQTAGINGDTG